MIKFAFFGSSELSAIVLDELERAGLAPSCIVSTPDKPQGRKMLITPTVVKDWGLKRNIKVYTPAKLDKIFIDSFKKENCEVSIVASYGKIIPETVISIPAKGTLNIHPSLLPQYRGASPLQSAILNDTKNTGVSIMLIDKEMDHGPILAQEKITINEWPPYAEFEKIMAIKGAQLLAEILPEWIEGKIKAKEQDHTLATFTKKMTKEDGLINLADDSYLNFRKIQAYSEWPQAYFLIEHGSKKIRVKITKASYKDSVLIIEKVIPEGGKEMTYEDFRRGYVTNNKN